MSGHSERQRANLRKNNIGFVFQSFNLIDELTVYENIELPLIYLGTSKQERKERVDRERRRVNDDRITPTGSSASSTGAS